MKKMLAIALTLVMLLSTATVSVSASHIAFNIPGVPAPVEFDGEYSEDGDYLYYFESDNTIKLYGYIGEETELIIPEEIDGYTVSAIDRYFNAIAPRFSGIDFPKLTKVSFPNTIEQLILETCHFGEVVVPDSVRWLGLGDCTIKKINVPEGVEEFYMIFTRFDELELPKSVKLINNGFENPFIWSGESITIWPHFIPNMENLQIRGNLQINSGTVRGFENSYIESYAAKKDLNFESIGVFGDVNQDGKFNGKDVLELRKSIVGLESSIDEYNSDVNFDGRINGKDVLAIRKQLVGLTSYLGEDTEPDDTTPVETPSDIVVEMPDNL